MELTLNLFQCPEDGPFLTWTGTVVIDGETFGWADEPLFVPDPPLLPNDNFGYFEENWTIFTLEDGDDPHVDASLACDDSRVVMAGTNTGWGPPGMTGKAEGELTYVAEPGPFDNVELGSRMFWNGKAPGYSASTPCCALGAKWKATLHIPDSHPTSTASPGITGPGSRAGRQGGWWRSRVRWRRSCVWQGGAFTRTPFSRDDRASTG